MTWKLHKDDISNTLDPNTSDPVDDTSDPIDDTFDSVDETLDPVDDNSDLIDHTGVPVPHYSDHASPQPNRQPAVQKQPSITEPDEQKADTKLSKHDNEQKVDTRLSKHDDEQNTDNQIEETNEQKRHTLSNPTTQLPHTPNHHPLAKRTRSGATYVVGSVEQLGPSHSESLHRCTQTQSSARKVTFCEQIEINTQGKISFSPLVDSKPSTNFFCLATIAFDADFSSKELLYQPINPQPLLDKIYFSTDDDQ